MPQLKLFAQPPGIPDQKLPTDGPKSVGDDVLRAIAVMLGIEGQKPGDLAGALGALGGMGLPMLGMNKGDKILRRAVPQWTKEGQIQSEIEAFKSRPIPGSMAEFSPKPQGNPLSDLPPEEITKAIELTKRKPKKP
jgi:hypothetical protein